VFPALASQLGDHPLRGLREQLRQRVRRHALHQRGRPTRPQPRAQANSFGACRKHCRINISGRREATDPKTRLMVMSTKPKASRPRRGREAPTPRATDRESATTFVAVPTSDRIHARARARTPLRRALPRRVASRSLQSRLPFSSRNHLRVFSCAAALLAREHVPD